jgi:hypothetical protein
MRGQIALSVALILLIVATTSPATATEASPARADQGLLAPLALPLVTGESEAAARGRIIGPGTASPQRSVVLEDRGVPPVPTAARRSQPAPVRGVVTKAIPKPKPASPASGGGHHRSSGGSSGHVLRGLASWYCNSNASRGPISSCHYQYPDTGAFNAYAAAGPKLRAALGNWRGRIVYVDGLRVKLIDWCQCYKGRSYEKLIDLYRDVYSVVGGSVTIRW